MITLKAVLVTADPELREQLQPLSKMALIHRCAVLRPGTVDTVTAATKHTLRAIARRWQHLDQEIKTHEALLGELTTHLVPQLVNAFGIGADTASEMLIVAGDNIDRVRSEPAWARLCGVAPIPASSGMTNRHRLNRGGHRQANAALYRAVIVRMRFHQPTIAYAARRTTEGKTKAEITRCLKRLLAREVRALLRPLRTWRTRDEAENDLFRYINRFCNTERIQKDLGWLSPDEYEAAWHTAQAEPTTIPASPARSR
jgi:hypothetical protein